MASPTQAKTDRASARAEKRVAELAAARVGLTAVDEHALSLRGLNTQQIGERRALGLTNAYDPGTSRSFASILRGNIFTLFNGVIFGSSFFLMFLGQWKDALFIYAAVANIAIGIVQEYRAKRTLDKLAVLNEPNARVRRNGELIEIHADQIVLDDLLELRPGDQVLGDCVVLESQNLELDESLLTGESEPVLKLAGAEALTGAGVVGGFGLARVVRLGPETFASKLTLEARRFSLVNSELRNALNRVIKWISWAMLPIFVISANGQMQAFGGWVHAIQTGKWLEAAVGSVAGITTLIPQGLVLLTSLAFAVSAMTLARKQVLLQEIAAVEGLARVDVVCFDKTGTLTEGEIEFDSVVAVDPAAHTAKSDGLLTVDEVLAHFGADPSANATSRCLATAFAVSRELEVVNEIAFDSAKKWSAFEFADTGRTKRQTWVLGAPEMILDAGDRAHATALGQARLQAETGRRTLLLAATFKSTSDDRTLPRDLHPVALVTFKERIRSDAAETIAYFKAQGVQIRIISGDNPQTVAAVAAEASGIDLGRGFDARELPTSMDELADLLERQVIYGRVTPEQKRDMVLALQSRGHVVAMTGDGVNDALALKKADLGIAMGSGAAATKAVANLILLDGKFASLPSVVAEGRRVTANIERVSRLFLNKTVWAILLVVTFGLLNWPFPFMPRHLTAVDVFMIGVPSVFLALLPNLQRYRSGFLGRSLRFCVPVGVGVAAAVIGLNAWARFETTWSLAESQTATALLLGISGLWVLANLARPFDRWRIVIVSAMYALAVLFFTVPLSTGFFGFTYLTFGQVSAVLFAALLSTTAISIAHWYADQRVAPQSAGETAISPRR